MAAAAGGDGTADSSGGDKHRPDRDGIAQPEIERDGLAWFTRNLVPIFQRRAWKRLRSTLAAYRKELAGRETDYANLPKIENALTGAERSLAAGDIDGGWKCFMAAQRLALLTCPEDELAAFAKSMRAEADKLGSWRKIAVLDLLKDDKTEAVLRLLTACENTEAVLSLLKGCRTPDGAPKPPATCEKPNRARVFHAALLRDEHYHNQAYRDGLRRSGALWTACALIGGLALLLWLAWDGALRLTLANPGLQSETAFRILLTVGVFGFLGATFSAAISMAAASAPTRIPEVVSSIRVTLVRLLIGPVSAIVICLAVQSAAYSFLFAKTPDGAAILIIAFVAGFTERLVARVVEAVAGRSSS